MITVELTKREVGALSVATRLGDIDDLEALRTAIDKLWKAADAQEHGDTWRIIHAGNRSRQTFPGRARSPARPWSQRSGP
jgi:hypothetical protein